MNLEGDKMASIRKMRLRLEDVRNELEMDLERIIRQNEKLEEISEELLGEKLADEVVEQANASAQRQALLDAGADESFLNALEADRNNFSEEIGDE